MTSRRQILNIDTFFTTLLIEKSSKVDKQK